MILAVTHLVFHPQSGVFREALRWLGRHPAPFLWLLASLMVHEAWRLKWGGGMEAGATAGPVSLSPWPGVFAECASRGWQRFALLFHQAVQPPPLLPGSILGALLMGLVSAAGQVWLCCYLVASRASVTAVTAFPQTKARWRTILALAGCHAVWWWLSTGATSPSPLARDWLMPEFLIFLGPLPLAAAASQVDFLKAGALTVECWRRHWPALLIFAATAVPLLVLLEYALHLLAELLPPARLVSRLLVTSVLSASLHCWLFVSAALLLLRGGYLEGKPHPQPPDA